MRFLFGLFFFLSCFSSFSQKDSDEIERSEYIDSINVMKNKIGSRLSAHEEKLGEEIDKLPSLTGCDNEKGQAEKIACVRETLDRELTDESKLEQIERVMGLRSHNLVKSKNKREIVGYIMKILSKRIHGQEVKKSKDAKHLSNMDFLRLNHEQMSNQILLETGTFCREKVEIIGASIITNALGEEKLNVISSKIDLNKQNQGSVNKFLDEASREQEGINFKACLGSIYKLCEEYKLNPTTNKENAQACLFKAKIARMQKTYDRSQKLMDDLDKSNKKIKTHSRFNEGAFHNRAYKRKFGGKDNLQAITQITSDMAMGEPFRKVDGYKDELNKACTKDPHSEECQRYLKIVEEKDVETIETDEKIKFAVAEKLVDKLSDEEARNMAKKYGFDKNEDVSDLKIKIKAELDAQKTAIIANIKREVHGKLKKNKQVDYSAMGGEARAMSKAEEEEYNAERLRDNIFYTNMVSSYLDLTYGNQKGSNTANPSRNTANKFRNTAYRDRELENLAKADRTEEDKQFFEDFKVLQQDVKKRASSPQGRSIANDHKADANHFEANALKSIFDVIISGKQEKEEDKNKK